MPSLRTILQLSPVRRSVLGVLLLITATPVSGQTAAQPGGDFETVVTLPSAGGTENIAEGSDGALYVTGIDDKVVWKVTHDGRAGTVTEFAKIPTVAAVVGVAASTDGVVVTVFGTPFRKPAAGGGAPQIDFSDIDPQVIALDRSGKVVATIHGEKGQAFNGIARVPTSSPGAGPDTYLIADSNASTIWRLDLGTRRLTSWLRDPLLAPVAGSPAGANGIKVRGGWVYVSVSGANAVYRVRMGADGRPDGSLTRIGEGVRPDDFDVAADGSVYLSSGTAVYRLPPGGAFVKILDNVPNGAAMLVSRDGRWVYWPTRGGTAPQRVLRTPVR
jgi:sugar lactone lactonase YvrE